MFPKLEQAEQHTACFRHAFKPAPTSITIERELRRICAKWQDHWDGKLADHLSGATSQPEEPRGPAISTLGQLFDHLHTERTKSVAKSTTSRDIYRLQVWRDALGNSTPLASLTPQRIADGLATSASEPVRPRRTGPSASCGPI